MCRGAGYTFGAQVVNKFLDSNNMVHILRAHQLCMEGFSVLYNDKLSTVWSAPNYCYRCGNMASILEVGPNGEKHFNVFDAAPENERDGPQQQQAGTGPSNVSSETLSPSLLSGGSSRSFALTSLTTLRRSSTSSEAEQPASPSLPPLSLLFFLPTAAC